VSKEKHDPAEVLDSILGLFPDSVLNRCDSKAAWVVCEESDGDDWGSGSDIPGLVKQALQSAIFTLGLKGIVKCFNELSILTSARIFGLCAQEAFQLG
jgi:hypothetical protein